MIKELSTRSTRHTASRTIRCLVAECDQTLHLRLSAIHIHIKSGHAFCTQIKNPTTALNAETCENFSVFSFYCTYNMMCVNEWRNFLRMKLWLRLFIHCIPNIHIFLFS
ncbi:hypothetical protein FC42_GL000759 [Lactobacillus iners DSM 13335]|nr:hypothetical protein FC42_GL000759 [Lactobacillus iners DSM 13335]